MPGVMEVTELVIKPFVIIIVLKEKLSVVCVVVVSCGPVDEEPVARAGGQGGGDARDDGGDKFGNRACCDHH